MTHNLKIEFLLLLEARKCTSKAQGEKSPFMWIEELENVNEIGLSQSNALLLYGYSQCVNSLCPRKLKIMIIS